MSDYTTTLIVPGLHGSGPNHWQTWWERKDRNAYRVEQDDWETPDLNVWAEKLRWTMEVVGGDVWIVAHSFGCLASLHVAKHRTDRIRGIFLVAPADPVKFAVAHQLPQHVLPFPTVLIASRTDPWLRFEAGQQWAKTLGSQFVDLGDAGHINAESGFGAWQAGFNLFRHAVRESERHALSMACGRPAAALGICAE